MAVSIEEKLIQIGVKQAFLQLKQEYSNVCLVHLYTLECRIICVSLWSEGTEIEIGNK